MAAGKRKGTGAKNSFFGGKKIRVMEMDIKKIDEENNVARFLFKGMEASFVNAIRRTIMEHVPTIAVEDVSIYFNNSVVFDEFLAQRLGLIALKTDLKGYDLGDKVKLVLEKEGPCVVYSRDIKSTDPKIEVVDNNIPIVKLGKDQSVKIEMEAVMGSGKGHVKWQPAIVAYQHLPVIKQKKELDQKTMKQVVDSCPTSVLEIKSNKVVLKDAFGCILCGACRDIVQDDSIEVNHEPDSFIFSIETTGSLTPKEVFEQSVKILGEKTGEFEKELKKLK